MKRAIDNEIDLRRFFGESRRRWWLYAVSAVVFLGAAAVYCVNKMPQYCFEAVMLIEDSNSDTPRQMGALGMMMKSFSIGGFGTSNAENEVLLISSHDVMARTVDRLGLNRTYIARDGLSKTLLFGDSPVTVDMPAGMLDTLSTSMRVRVVIDGGRASVTVRKAGLFSPTVARADDTRLPCSLDTQWGTITVNPGPDYKPDAGTVDINITGTHIMAEELARIVDIEVVDKMADAISLSVKDGNRRRGLAILNTLMECYNAKRLGRKHQNARDEILFLDQRISELAAQLDTAEHRLERYKTDNRLAAIDSEAALLAESSVTSRAEVVKARAEMLYYSQVLETLRDPARADEPLPVFEGSAYPMVRDYNQMLMRKKELERSALPGNAALESANANIARMREAAIGNIEGLLEAARLTADSGSGLVAEAAGRLQKLPRYEREYIDLFRDQKLKNELYVFLLEKRESAMLRLHSADSLGFVVDEAYMLPRTSKTKAVIVIAAALLLTLLVPAAVVAWLLWHRDSVDSPVDLAFIGLEHQAVAYGGSRADTGRLRSLLRGLDGVGCVFVAPLSGDTSPADALAESLRAIGCEVIATPPCADNDQLLAMHPQPGEAYTFATVPCIDRLAELVPVVNAPSGCLLLIMREGTVRRRRLRRMLRGFDAGHIISVITSR